MLPNKQVGIEIKLPEGNDYDSQEWEEFSDLVSWGYDLKKDHWDDNGGYIPAEEKS